MTALLDLQDIRDAALLANADDATTNEELLLALLGSRWIPQATTQGGSDFIYNSANAAGFIAIKNGVMAITFAGTANAADVVTDIAGGLTSWDPYYDEYVSFIARAADLLIEAGSNITKVLITGHSLGGAMAELLLADWIDDDRVVGVTFGSPGVEADIDSLGIDRLLRIEHSDDIVVDLAQEVVGWPGGNSELDTRIDRLEGSISSLTEHRMKLYRDSVEVMLKSDLAEFVFGNYEEQSQDGGNLVCTQQADIITLSGDNHNTFLSGGGDSMTGTSFLDIVSGGDGNDTMSSRGGDDYIYGEAGDDLISGGSESDRLFGGLDRDLIFGGDQNDYLYGGVGKDVIAGGLGNDRIYGNSENDSLVGFKGNDLIVGGSGRDTLSGGDDNDTLYGEDGIDQLTGGGGADQFHFAQWYSGADAVLDFKTGLDNIFFVATTGDGSFMPELGLRQFLSGVGLSQAATLGQRFIYDTSTGSLYFDVDGAGGSNSIKIAVLDGLAPLAASDIIWDFE